MVANIGFGDGKSQQIGAFSKAKMMVVDEDVNDICGYCGMLRQRGSEAHCVSSYAEGAACLNDERVDMVIVR
jgi:hypothetical protein